MLQRPAAQRNAVKLQLADGDPSVRVEADADKLKQILINLLDHAVKFSPPEASVRVRAQPAAAALRILIEDQGPGVPVEDVPHLFERFFRGRSAGAATGSGLGLAIAKNLARLHGGDITLKSAPGQGSTFTLNLPAAGSA
jgi:signal transduction histidine kinase